LAWLGWIQKKHTSILAFCPKAFVVAAFEELAQGIIGYKRV
jgi:hypothetical protein